MRQVSFGFGILFILNSTSFAAETLDIKTQAVTVVGEDGQFNPNAILPSVTQLKGEKLNKKKEASLGETLGRELGVSSTQFGQGASRPVIRGFDGERIRVLENNTGVFDASGASPDHAVSVDPLLIDEVEILRGPTALLYGNTAIGGVVNVKTFRVQPKPLTMPITKLAGRVTSADLGRSFGVLTRRSVGQNYSVHADASLRASQNYESANGEIQNSFQRAQQLGLGATRHFSNGHVGMAASFLGSEYGTVFEPEVSIDLERFRLELEGEHRTGGFFKTIQYRGSANSYRHIEFEGEEVGTTFRNRGGEVRVQTSHQLTGNVGGFIGAQAQAFRFLAQGEEAYVPTTNTTQIGTFLFEEWKLGKFVPSLGVRGDWTGVQSVASDNVNFGGAKSRNHFLPSFSLGTKYQWNEGTVLNLNLSATSRAPNYQELFAFGHHVATSTYEIGNTNLKVERGYGAEVSLKKKTENHEWFGSIYFQNVPTFIGLLPTGQTDTALGLGTDDVNVYEFRTIQAQFFGSEFSWEYRIPNRFLNGFWSTELKLDFVRAINQTQRTSIARIAPIRETFEISYQREAYTSVLEFQRSERQSFVAENETPTPAYMWVNCGVTVPFAFDTSEFQIFGRVQNLFNAEARNHVSFLKDVAPLMGRSFVFGFQAAI